MGGVVLGMLIVAGGGMGWLVRDRAAQQSALDKESLAALTDEWRRVLERSDFRTGCAVFAVATEDDADLRATASRVFGSWRERLAEVLVEHGVARDRAPRLARTVVAAVEGAVALCRAERSLAPLEEVAVELGLLIDSAVSPSRRSPHHAPR